MAKSGGDDWTPDKPLDDDEDEKEAQARARNQSRVDFLREQYGKKPKGGGGVKERPGW